MMGRDGSQGWESVTFVEKRFFTFILKKNYNLKVKMLKRCGNDLHFDEKLKLKSYLG